MDRQFWLDRWQRREIGFHRAEVNPLLERHWPALNLPNGARVLVPLAGKSLDMTWLAAQGFEVVGVELADDACAEYFDEHGLTPHVDTHGPFTRRRAGNLTLLAGDIFDLPDDFFAGIAGVYDRGALVALPPDLRRRYVAAIYGRLDADAQALLIALDYPQAQMAGPPFAIGEADIQALFGVRWRYLALQRQDILGDEPRFQQAGLTRLHSTAWHLRRIPSVTPVVASPPAPA